MRVEIKKDRVLNGVKVKPGLPIFVNRTGLLVWLPLPKRKRR